MLPGESSLRPGLCKPSPSMFDWREVIVGLCRGCEDVFLGCDANGGCFFLGDPPNAGDPGVAGVERPELGAEDAAFLRWAASAWTNEGIHQNTLSQLSRVCSYDCACRRHSFAMPKPLARPL